MTVTLKRILTLKYNKQGKKKKDEESIQGMSNI